MFLIRKHLYFSVDEWVRLPWWQQRMYVDQLNEQIALDNGEEPEPDPSEVASSFDALAGLGFNIEQAPVPADQ